MGARASLQRPASARKGFLAPGPLASPCPRCGMNPAMRRDKFRSPDGSSRKNRPPADLRIIGLCPTSLFWALPTSRPGAKSCSLFGNFLHVVAGFDSAGLSFSLLSGPFAQTVPADATFHNTLKMKGLRDYRCLAFSCGCPISGHRDETGTGFPVTIWRFMQRIDGTT